MNPVCWSSLVNTWINKQVALPIVPEVRYLLSSAGTPEPACHSWSLQMSAMKEKKKSKSWLKNHWGTLKTDQNIFRVGL